MYRTCNVTHWVTRFVRLVGLCGIVAAAAPLSAAAGGPAAMCPVKEISHADLGSGLLGPGLESAVLDEARGSGLLQGASPDLTRSTTTAVILWDEWKRRIGGGSGAISAAGQQPAITVRYGQHELYSTGTAGF